MRNRQVPFVLLLAILGAIAFCGFWLGLAPVGASGTTVCWSFEVGGPPNWPRGGQGSEHLIGSFSVPVEHVGDTYDVIATIVNDPGSVHPNTNVSVRSGGDAISLYDVEEFEGKVSTARGRMTFGEEVRVYVILGEDGVASIEGEIELCLEEIPTATPTSTNTPSPTSTNTPVPPTNTPSPTATQPPTFVPTSTNTPSPSNTPSPTATTVPQVAWHAFGVCDIEPDEVEIRGQNTNPYPIRMTGQLYARPDGQAEVLISEIPPQYQVVESGDWGGPEERIENWFTYFSGVVYGWAEAHTLSGEFISRYELPETRLLCGQEPTETPPSTPPPPANQSLVCRYNGDFGLTPGVYFLFTSPIVEVKPETDGIVTYFHLGNDQEWGRDNPYSVLHGPEGIMLAQVNITVTARSPEGIATEYSCTPIEQPAQALAAPTEVPCPTCPEAVCLLEPNTYVTVGTGAIVGLPQEGPQVFASEAQALEAGLSYAGYECSICTNYLVNTTDRTVWVTEGSTAYDIAVALNLAEGSPAPNYLDRHMDAALQALGLWYHTEGRPAGWYSYALNQ